jgi:5-methylcytosine-specific restriction endonuclease McrA
MLKPTAIGRRRGPGSGRQAMARPTATRREWAIIRTAVVLRARGRSQACGQRRPLDVHHVIKRSQGGSDFDLDRLVALCRRCHEWTDAPYHRGRLVITPIRDGVFGFMRVWRLSKWAAVHEGGGEQEPD